MVDDSEARREPLGVPPPPRSGLLWPAVLFVRFVVAVVLFFTYGVEALSEAN